MASQKLVLGKMRVEEPKSKIFVQESMQDAHTMTLVQKSKKEQGKG
jgi:hypothetical protein